MVSMISPGNQVLAVSPWGSFDPRIPSETIKKLGYRPYIGLSSEGLRRKHHKSAVDVSFTIGKDVRRRDLSQFPMPNLYNYLKFGLRMGSLGVSSGD